MEELRRQLEQSTRRFVGEEAELVISGLGRNRGWIEAVRTYPDGHKRYYGPAWTVVEAPGPEVTEQGLPE